MSVHSTIVKASFPFHFPLSNNALPFLRIMLFNPLCFLIRGSNFLRIFNGQMHRHYFAQAILLVELLFYAS
ncbi:Uncharacterised protein [Vibrio cholerae]|nr:Uncharacterised protein [Vibrio cholerae]